MSYKISIISQASLQKALYLVTSLIIIKKKTSSLDNKDATDTYELQEILCNNSLTDKHISLFSWG